MASMDYPIVPKIELFLLQIAKLSTILRNSFFRRSSQTSRVRFIIIIIIMDKISYKMFIT